MAKQKMTKDERSECERNLVLCQSAVATFQRMLADDDSASKSAAKAADAALVKSIIDRDGVTAGVLACREFGRRGGPQG
jgi:hypothetical protein